MPPSDIDLLRLAGPLRVLPLEDLRAAGLSYKQVRGRLRQGRLQQLWRGMFLVGPAPPPLRSWARAAGLPGRDRFVAAGWATAVHGFGWKPQLPVDVMTLGSTGQGIKGKVRVHRSELLLPCDLCEVGGIAVTSPARAILDCGDFATVSQLETLIANAELKKTVTRAQLEDVLSRAGRRAAARKLTLALADSPGVTRSIAERRLRRLLNQAKLEQPITDYPIGIYFADFAWPKYMLVVEFDSYSHHSAKRDFFHDRERNAYITSKAWSILPVTWQALEARPFEVVKLIAEAIARRSR
jgi:very-short-patch-repair endonuclease